MKTVQKIEFHTGSKEERLPGFTDEFPYIATRVEQGVLCRGTGTGRWKSFIWRVAVWNIIRPTER